MKSSSWSLRSVLPRLEIDWLLPFWLLLAIIGAAVAETVTIGLGVWRAYSLWTGWLVGGVVASSQAMGSMMWARASQHNARRKVYMKAIGPRDARRSVEDEARSEPKLSVFWPALISVLAGVVSGWVGMYLYQRSELAGLGRALAVASPAGSIAAAVLNGVFASGEAAIAEFAERRKGRKAAQASEAPALASEPAAQPEPAMRCWCGYPLRNSQALSAHSKRHLNEVAQAASAAEAKATLAALYPDATLPGMAEIADMWKKATK